MFESYPNTELGRNIASNQRHFAVFTDLERGIGEEGGSDDADRGRQRCGGSGRAIGTFCSNPILTGFKRRQK